MSVAPASAAGRISVLDGLRAMAILLVLARHAVRPFLRDNGEPLLPLLGHEAATLAINGWIGVDLFFVLSGFLIARHLLRTGRKASFGSYLAQRALRIVPSYYVVLFAAALGAFPFHDPGAAFIWTRVAYHAMFLQDYLPANIVVAFWSLGVEEKFYLLAPALLALTLTARSTRRRLLVLAAMMAISPISRLLTSLGREAGAIVSYEVFFPLYRSPFHACLETLLVGIACALLHREVAIGRLRALAQARAARVLLWAGLLPLASLALGAPMLGRIGFFEIVLQPSLVALGFGALLLGAVLGAPECNWLAHRVWAPVARLSYAAYLVHMPLIPLSMLVTEILLPTSAPAAGRLAMFLVPYLLVTAGVALLLHHLVERPFLRLKDRLAAGAASTRGAVLMTG